MSIEVKRLINSFMTELSIKKAQEAQAEDINPFFSFDNLRLSSAPDIEYDYDEIIDMLIEEGYAGNEIRSFSIEEIENMELYEGKLCSQEEIEEVNPDELEEFGKIIDEEEDIQSVDEGIEEAAEEEITEEETPEVSEVPQEVEQTPLDEEIETPQDPEVSEVPEISETPEVSDVPEEKDTIKLTKEEIDEYKSKSELLRDIYNDEDIMAIVDENGDGKISEEEKAKFESYIQGDKDKLELEDIKKVCKEIKDNKFDKDDYKKYKIPDKKETDETKDKKPQSVSSSGGSSGGGGSYSATPSAKERDLSDINQMTLDELKVEQQQREQRADSAKEQLNDVYNGNNAQVKSAKENYDKMQDLYKEALKEESPEVQALESQREEQLTNIEATNKSIDELNININNTDSQIFAKNTEISACDSAISALQSALSSYEGSEDEEGAADATAAIEAQIASLEEQKAALEEEKSSLEEQKTQYESSLAEQQGFLSEYEQNYQDISSQIKEISSEETKEALNNFDEAKQQLQTIKEEQAKSIKTNVLEPAMKDLKTVNDLIIEKEAKQLERNSSNYDPVKDSLNSDIKGMNKLNIKGPPEMVVMVPEGADLSKELTATVFLHGDYQNGSGDYGSLSHLTTPAGSDWGGYNGIVIIPRAGGDWSGGISEDLLLSCIQSAQQASGCTISTENMVLMGASRGAQGVLNTANQSWASKYFGAVVAISGFQGEYNSSIPLITSWGTNGDDGAGFTSNLKSNAQIPVSSDHGNVVYKLFQFDSNSNGIPDVLETAYGLMS